MTISPKDRADGPFVYDAQGVLITTPEDTAALAAGEGTPQASAISQQLIGANSARKGLVVTVDVAAASGTVVYFRLGASAASQAAHDFSLGPGGSFDGLVSGELWDGAIQFQSPANTPFVGVAEV